MRGLAACRPSKVRTHGRLYFGHFSSYREGAYLNICRQHSSRQPSVAPLQLTPPAGDLHECHSLRGENGPAAAGSPPFREKSLCDHGH